MAGLLVAGGTVVVDGREVAGLFVDVDTVVGWEVASLPAAVVLGGSLRRVVVVAAADSVFAVGSAARLSIVCLRADFEGGLFGFV